MRNFLIVSGFALLLCVICAIYYFINTKIITKHKSKLPGINEPNPQKATETENKDEYNLKRFLEAQEGVYEIALKEIRDGCKRSHWMWFIFPQLEGLGYTPTAQYYAIKSAEEAKEYATHPILGQRLKEITRAALDSEELDIDHLLGYPDDLKLKSCMTLFYLTTREELFQNVLKKYFDGEMCKYTVEKIKEEDL